MEPMFTTRPRFAAAIDGTTACTMRSTEKTFASYVCLRSTSGTSSSAPASNVSRARRWPARPRTAALCPSVVHEDVDASLAVKDFSHGALHILLLGDVERQLRDARGQSVHLLHIARGRVYCAAAPGELLASASH
jgi:hypothetical protein